MATFTLNLSQEEREAFPQPAGWEGLGSTVLLHNARWFTRIRWAVVGVLVAFGLVNAVWPDVLALVGIVSPSRWPWCLAAVLTAANGAFLLILRVLSPNSPRPVVAGIIWLQIVIDLCVVTGLVYVVGPFDTFVAFAYVFHVVLACIFFAPRESMLVVLLSATLFLTVVALELTGLLPQQSIVVTGSDVQRNASAAILWAVSAVFIWLVIWYLVSTISSTVRRRDRQLAVANEGLRQADKEKTLQVLRVTHDLKAPFSGIENNIQMLRHQYWDDIPEEVRVFIRRIEQRSATLRDRIRDVLALGELRTAGEREPALERVDLQELISEVVHDLSERSQQQAVTVTSEVPALTLVSDPKQLTFLFANLLSNAIGYSEKGTIVRISANEKKGVRVRIADQGIGISEKALPHIFEDYYRSREAAGFNPRSTGLGLAIVRQIAQNLGLTLSVESEMAKGTTFEVQFPSERRVPGGQDRNR